MLNRNEKINIFFKNLLEEFKEFYTYFKISKNKDNCYFGFNNTKNSIIITFFDYKIKISKKIYWKTDFAIH